MKWEDFERDRPPFHVTFWADEASLGELTFRNEPFGQTMSTFFYCSVCEQVWGMIEYPNRHWLPAHVTCKDHRDERSVFCVPGSLLPAYVTADELLHYPEALLRREFELTLKELGV
jgi:hypothetical protein